MWSCSQASKWENKYIIDWTGETDKRRIIMMKGGSLVPDVKS